MPTTYAQGPAAGTLRTSGISSASVASGKTYLGSAIDNSSNLDAFADIEIVWSYGVTPTAGTNLQIYLLYAADGTNYEEPTTGDGSSTTALPISGKPLWSVPVTADTSTHRRLFTGIPVPPYKLKPFVYNATTGQTATVTVNLYTRKDQTVG